MFDSVVGDTEIYGKSEETTQKTSRSSAALGRFFNYKKWDFQTNSKEVPVTEEIYEKSNVNIVLVDTKL